LKGSCEIINNNGQKQETFLLDLPRKCLIVEPEDWHVIDQFSPGTILMVLASEYFDEADYIFENYP